MAYDTMITPAEDQAAWQEIAQMIKDLRQRARGYIMVYWGDEATRIWTS